VNRQAFTDPATFEEEKKKAFSNPIHHSVGLARSSSARVHHFYFEETPHEIGACDGVSP
jgi:hypothetical protein